MSDEPFKLRRLRSRRLGKPKSKTPSVVGMVSILVVFSGLGLLAMFYSQAASGPAQTADPVLAPEIEWNIVDPSESTEQITD